MRFEKALEALREGKKVYQKKYNDKQLSLINNNMIKNDDILIKHIKTEDILAEDWEIVKEPVTIEELEEKIKELQNKLKEQNDNWYKSFETKSKGLFATMKDCKALAELVLKLSPERKEWLDKHYGEYL